MLDFFQRLLGRTPKPAPTPATPQKQFDTLNQLAPLKSGAPRKKEASRGTSAAAEHKTPSLTASFVCREPVLNQREQIAGYTFDLQEGLQTRLQGRQDMLHRAYDDALLRSLATLNIPSLLEHRLAFVTITPTSLSNPLLMKLPPKNTVLILKPSSQPLNIDELVPQLQALRKAGFAHGWVLSKTTLKEHHPSLTQLAIQADYLQLQVSSFNGREIESLHKALTSRRSLHQGKLHLLATELHSFDEFNLCFHIGFDYFQGHFITSREDWHPPKSEINRVLALKLLNLLRTDEELKVIADQITADPVMTYKLLRYLNSPAIGLQTPILTIDKALLLLGRERCFRWLSLLLFDIKQTGFRERLLIEQALARAFFLESLAGLGQVPDRKDELFILGLFSMLDLLIGHPLPQLLEHTQLPEAIHQALLGQEGIYHTALALAQASEANQSEQIHRLANACGFDALQILERSIQALSKAHATMGLSEG